MSVEYDEYLLDHIDNVNVGFRWLRDNIPEVLKGIDPIKLQYGLKDHDISKYDVEEYFAYDAYFYGEKNDLVTESFNYAWLRHIHKNPHHWQHWVLINDDPDEGEIIMDMPKLYIIEMICDWWAFSWKKFRSNREDLYEIFSWYSEHKDYMKLSDKTRKEVEYILGKIKEKLDWLNDR